MQLADVKKQVWKYSIQSKGWNSTFRTISFMLLCATYTLLLVLFKKLVWRWTILVQLLVTIKQISCYVPHKQHILIIDNFTHYPNNLVSIAKNHQYVLWKASCIICAGSSLNIVQVRASVLRYISNVVMNDHIQQCTDNYWRLIAWSLPMSLD